MIKRTNQTVLSAAYSRLRAQDESEEEKEAGEEFLTVKRRHVHTPVTGVVSQSDEPKEPTQALAKQRAQRAAYLRELAHQLREQDLIDKNEHTQRLREKRWELKRKLREQAPQEVGSIVLQQRRGG